MTRRHALIAAAAVLVSVVAVVIGRKLGQGPEGPDEELDVSAPELEIFDGETVVTELYFPGPEGRLYVEEREVPLQEDILRRLDQLLTELLSGPATEDLFPALPPEITLGWLHLNPVGVLYVDFRFAGETEFPAWGSREEMLAVYSVVNTVLASSPEIAAVVILRDGQQRSTFAGHLDTSRPLLADQSLIASR